MILPVLVLLAPGSVSGLTYGGALHGELGDAGVLILRDERPQSEDADEDAPAPPEEVVVLARTTCAPSSDPLHEDTAEDSRWSWRWKTIDAFSFHGSALTVRAEDSDGPWSRTCAISEMWSCYVPHAQDWVDSPVDDKGLDSGSYDLALASARAWTGTGDSCTRVGIRSGKIVDLGE